MADAIKFPTRTTGLQYFQWSRPDAARPALAQDLSSSDTTVYFNYAPKNAAGAVITQPFVFVVKRAGGANRGFRMQVYCPNGADGTNGLSATAIVQGIAFNGLDYTTSDSDYLLSDGFKEGDPIECAISPTVQHLLVAALQGEIGTGGNALRIGDVLAGDKYLYAQNADASKPFLRYNDTLNVWELSNDGTSTSALGSGSSVTGGDGITVTSGDIDIDLTDTTIFVQSSSGAGDAGKVPRLAAGTGKLATGFITSAPFTTYISDSAALVGGAASNADALHTHASLGAISATAYEALSADNAVCLLPVDVEYFSQMTDTVVNLGDSNVRRRYAVKFIPSVTGTLTDMKFRAAEQVNGATTLGNLIVSIQTDSAGAPSGTALTNATATISQATQRTWNTTMATRTATFGGTVNFTAGTTYWFVIECSATDAANYLKIGANDTYATNYLTFTRLTYNLDTASWGSSTTSSILFFWSNTTANAFGYALGQTDNNLGNRTWNFIGFVTANVSAQATATVYTDIVTFSALTLTPGKDYYIDSTAGAITSTSPDYVNTTTTISSFVQKIGRAISSTQLKIEKGPKKVVFADDWVAADNSVSQAYIIWFKFNYLTMYVGDTTAVPDGMPSIGIATSASKQIPFGFTSSGYQFNQSGGYIMENPGGGATDPTATITSVSDVGFNVTPAGISGIAANIYPYYIVEG